MYRVRTPSKAKPLVIASELLAEYSINNVDTLHKKNLLSLGEDRFLTTLMLKHFPDFRTKFTPDAHCETVVPDKVEVLLSQRRRWINSTIHNQWVIKSATKDFTLDNRLLTNHLRPFQRYELLLVGQLCGFLCFSMRFVVALDLFATFTLPAACIYLVYLIYASIQSQTAPTISLIMLAIAYGLQMVIFILKRKFEHIGWMIISILAMPFFSFYLPLYSFWHFDDFTWGNTRRVAGSSGKDGHGGYEGEQFDPAVIPVRTWEKYVADVTAEHEKAEKSAQLAPEEQIQATVKMVVTPADSRPATTYSAPPYASSDVSGSGIGRPVSVAASNYAPSVMTGSVTYAAPPITYTAPQYAAPPIPQQPTEMVMLARPAPAVTAADTMDMRAMAAAMPAIPSPLPAGMPSDDEIIYQIRVLLSTHDLQSLTKKKVREELSAIFGVDMSSKKQFISDAVEAIMGGEL